MQLQIWPNILTFLEKKLKIRYYKEILKKNFFLD